MSEALLNSRSLCSLSNDPNADASSTSFFISGTLIAFSKIKLEVLCLVDYYSGNITDATFKTAFWKRWYNDYLHKIQRRH